MILAAKLEEEQDHKNDILRQFKADRKKINSLQQNF